MGANWLKIKIKKEHTVFVDMVALCVALQTVW